MATLDFLNPIFAWNMYWAYETPQQQEADHRTLGMVITLTVFVIIWAYGKLKQNMAEHTALLHPAPKQYPMPAPYAFARIRDLLAETNYNFGDCWHVVTADTNTGHIVANLSFVQEQSEFDPENGGLHKQYLKRFITVDATITDQGNDTSIVQLDFDTRCEGLSFRACDSIITSLEQTIDTQLT
jgi:hypothetical protein